ncbi:capsular polysaccharide export protein, LipB/KpsS family [Roseivirga thermotolerans]|uniref:Capsule biosynthesis protein n=1 Tax=Roseivirga thermotolerans TaxID=1758176 RepID=A0ABQ3I164_9BACT|nr:hypothetical protein [Roseivirga thermotolerans]GHE53455.1 hypothetical protein GCM10011340_04960 [Roseivirga thermotolerans]
MSNRIVLIGYPAEYFLSLALYFEENDLETLWIVFLNADYEFLKKNGVNKDNICYANEGFKFEKNKDIGSLKLELSEVEKVSDLMVNDIILMDRNLSTKSYDFCIQYLGHIKHRIADFIDQHKPGIATTWRDTAPQILGSLVCKTKGIQCTIATRIRIPNDLYGFSTSIYTDDLIELRRENVEEDKSWAADFLKEFREGKEKAELKIATRSFMDVLKLIPNHLGAFYYNLRRSFADWGNNFNRYTILQILTMYLRRRYRLFIFKLIKPYVKKVDTEARFALYALHTQPESSIDVQASFFSNQIETIRIIARSLPADYYLYVKIHPTDVDGKSLDYYNEIRSIPGVRLINYSYPTPLLMKKAELIFSLTGTIAYEAALYGRKAIVFAKNFYNHFPTIFPCKSPLSLKHQIREVLELKLDKSKLDEQIIESLAYLKPRVVQGSPSRVYGTKYELLRESDKEVLLGTYRLLANQQV